MPLSRKAKRRIVFLATVTLLHLLGFFIFKQVITHYQKTEDTKQEAGLMPHDASAVLSSTHTNPFVLSSMV